MRQYLTNEIFGFGSFERQRRKRPAALLKSGLVRLTIRQTLAGGALNGKVCAFPIGEAELDALIVSEIKFREVAMKMLLGAMLIVALHAALED